MPGKNIFESIFQDYTNFLSTGDGFMDGIKRVLSKNTAFRRQQNRKHFMMIGLGGKRTQIGASKLISSGRAKAASMAAEISGSWNLKSGASMIFKNPVARGGGIMLAGVTAGALVGMYSLSKSILSTYRWTSPPENKQYGVGYGPGFISWSKKGGMPANHLSTNGLTNALHGMRHSSII